MSLFESLNLLLGSPQTTERQVHALLKLELDFVTGMFADSWNYAESYAEVSFGSDFRADFVVLCANSGYWTAHIVELKSPNATLYLSSGDKSKDLQLVERQLAQREDWRRQNELAFRQVLTKQLPRGTAAQCSHASEHQTAKPEILDTRTVIHMECHAVIGRSSGMSPEARERRRLDDQRRGEWGSPNVLTYDRLLAKAERLNDAA
ncbi:MAG TPA: Shedu anti-phage system protein SduA domain-containing protein [Rhodocyclaceae bacterium]|nr:Shedu anti-phage system protein SduA domain-containing protein [Rhodocyclaceae bacterium]